MFRKLLALIALLSVLSLAACTELPPAPEGKTTPGSAASASQVGLPNPASVFCRDNGGTLEIRKDAAGNETGFCLFPDGTECEEWAFFRGECKPGATPAATPVR